MEDSLMSSFDEIPLAEVVLPFRDRLLDLIDRTSTHGSASQLPTSDALDAGTKKLRQNEYLVLVVGEAKRGKSSFINALIGRPLLPADVSVATNQVFRIKQAPQEAYRVVFEDGTGLLIGSDELAKYGSQTFADLGDVPRLDQVIRWIEIDGPVTFLPKEITLLDTPGLGSLYAGHARVTNRFTPLADAIIFTLGSDSPISDSEVKFLKEILNVTPHVFFIQTMIDRYRRDAWQAILKRNTEILREQVGDRLKDIAIWPVSSKNLLQAAQTGDDDYVDVSQFRPLAKAMQKFLYRAAGRMQMEQLLVLLQGHLRSGANTLTSRRKSLVEDSTAQRNARTQKLNQRKSEFQQEWGEQGRKKRKLRDDAEKTVRGVKQEFVNTVSPSGVIAQDIQNRIDRITSIDEARSLNDQMADLIAEQAESRWQTIRSATQGQCQKLLTEFLTEMETPVIAETELELNLKRDLHLATDTYTLYRSSMREGGALVGVVVGGVSIAPYLIPAIAASTMFPPLALLGIAAAGFFGLRKGYNTSIANQLREAKNQLEKLQRDLLARVHTGYCSANTAAGIFSSIVDEYFDKLLAIVGESIAQVVQNKSADADAEIARLADENRLDESQRKQRADEYDRQSKEWSGLQTDLEIMFRDWATGNA